jgi:hypothetical protein
MGDRILALKSLIFTFIFEKSAIILRNDVVRITEQEWKNPILTKYFKNNFKLLDK